MDLCGIVFCSPVDEARAVIWAALIGLVAAILTIGAAVVVGLRQAAITRDQTRIQQLQAEIASRALEIEDLKVRGDLFDKRFEVLRAAQSYLTFIIDKGDPPGFPHEHQDEETKRRSFEVSRAFAEALQRSRYLFGEDAHDRLHEELWGPTIPMQVAFEAVAPGDMNAIHALRRAWIQRFWLVNLDDILGDKLRVH